MKKDRRYKDVTKEYFAEATPGRGNIDKERGYIDKNNKNEIRVAHILHKELGGDVLLINDNIRKEGQEIPDYKWNEALWDLKSPESISFDEMVNVIYRRWLSTGQGYMSNLDVMVIQDNRIIRVIRFYE